MQTRRKLVLAEGDDEFCSAKRGKKQTKHTLFELKVRIFPRAGTAAARRAGTRPAARVAAGTARETAGAAPVAGVVVALTC